MLQVEVIFLGDIYLGDTPSIDLDEKVLEILRKADLVIANQEGPITQVAQENPSKCCLRSGITSAERLRRWGIDVVSLANNHMYDYGWDGFDETRRKLTDAGIRFLGAGRDLKEAMQPLIVEVGGIQIALLAYSWGLVQTTCATANSFGCAPLEKDLMIRQIREMKARVDTVVVLPHWGYCEYRYPPPAQVELGEQLIQSGATAVVGHHSHIVQGFATREDRLIAYSLGNFAFERYTDRGRGVDITQDNRDGAILRLRFSLGQVLEHEVIPTVLARDHMIHLDRTPKREDILRKRSIPLIDGDYSQYWRRYVRARMLRRLLYWANVLNWRRMHRETFYGAWLMLKGMLARRIRLPL